MQASDLLKLQHAEPALANLAMAVAKKFPDMGITETLRTLEDEKKAIATGKSSLKDPRYCKHLPDKNGRSAALDYFKRLPDGKADWDDLAWYRAVGHEFITQGVAAGVKISYGGDWKTFKDNDHVEIV